MAKITDITVNGKPYEFLDIPTWARIGSIESSDKTQSLARKTLIGKDLKGFNIWDIKLDIDTQSSKDTIKVRFMEGENEVRSIEFPAPSMRELLYKAESVYVYMEDKTLMKERNDLVAQGGRAIANEYGAQLRFDDPEMYPALFSIMAEAIAVTERRSPDTLISHPHINADRSTTLKHLTP